MSTPENNTQANAQDLVVEKSVQLSLIEVFIGSFLHIIKVPFSGHFLSLNQGLLLLKFSENAQNRFASTRLMIEVSLVASTMKALAPAGKKLGPMLSISMQGLLLSLGQLIFGINIFGQIIGMILLSLWAFCQPIVSYFLIYGLDMIKAFDYLLARIKKYTGVSNDLLLKTLIIAISIKLVLACLIPFVLKYLNRIGWDQYDSFFRKKVGNNILLKGFRDNNPSAIKGTIKDLTSPAFLISLVLMGSFFLVTEKESVQVFWKILRALAIAFLLFYLTRAKWMQNLFQNLARKSKYFSNIYQLSEKSLNQMLIILGKKK